MTKYYVSMIIYDLSEEDKLNLYRKFRKTLLKEGYYLIQKSVYGKIYKNKNQCERFYKTIEDFDFLSSKIQALILTSEQFSKIYTLHGTENIGEIILKQNVYILEF
ncbi:MAG: CRISPR-associated endonuclease Cas2 [Methanobrevibacter sp. CfCl-M3]